MVVLAMATDAKSGCFSFVFDELTAFSFSRHLPNAFMQFVTAYKFWLILSSSVYRDVFREVH